MGTTSKRFEVKQLRDNVKGESPPRYVDRPCAN